MQNDPAYQEMDEAAYDMAAEYANAEGLIEMKKYQGKDGKVNMCKALEDMRAEALEEGLAKGIEQGIERGIEQGISAFIEAYQEFRVSREETLGNLCDKFNLSRNLAEEYMLKYWK